VLARRPAPEAGTPTCSAPSDLTQCRVRGEPNLIHNASLDRQEEMD